MGYQPISVRVNPEGEITVQFDGIVQFDGKVAHVDRLKTNVGNAMWLPVDTRMAINDKIDDRVARWKHKHLGSPDQEPDEPIQSRGCFGVTLALLLVVPLAAFLFTILWCWGDW